MYTEIAVHCIPLQEWELCKIEMVLMIRITCNATYVACLPLLCQGSKWLNGRVSDSATESWAGPGNEATSDLYSEDIAFESQLDPGICSLDLVQSAYCQKQ